MEDFEPQENVSVVVSVTGVLTAAIQHHPLESRKETIVPTNNCYDRQFSNVEYFEQQGRCCSLSHEQLQHLRI